MRVFGIFLVAFTAALLALMLGWALFVIVFGWWP